jgi:nicotinamidase-related amidase
MNSHPQKSALVIIDYINEIIDPKGKLAGKGYAAFDEKHKTLDKVRGLIEIARRKQFPIFFVRIGFSPSYVEQPESSPLFGGAKKFGALQLGSWATEFHPKVAPSSSDMVINKHRVSAFYGTPLDIVLKKHEISDVFIAGVATDLAVQSAARDAHDRDYNVIVVSDCCAAASDEDHETSLRVMGKIAKVITLKDIP